MSERSRKLGAKDRSMQEQPKEGSVFFFPKRNPPVSVRAGSLQEAVAILESNTKEA